MEKNSYLAMFLAIAAAFPLMSQGVEGRVLEDTSGDPLASAELKFHKAGMRELAADLETERDGRFRVESLPAGEYTVDVSKPNHITTTLKLRLPATGVLVRLVRYAIITGTVRDTAGKPLPGRELYPGGRTSGSARVAILVKQPGSEQLKPVRTVPLGDGGAYRIFDLPPGQYAVGLWWAGLSVGSGAQMYPDNSHPRFFDVAGGEDYRDIDFLVVSGPSFSVSGKIEGATGKKPYSLALGLPELPQLPVAQKWTEEDGSFRLEKIPPGTYDLYVAGPTGGYGAFDSVLGTDPLYGRMRIQVIGQNVEGVSVPVSAGRTLDLILREPSNGCPKTAQVTLSFLEPWGLMAGNRVQAGIDKAQTARDLAPGKFVLSAENLGPGCYQVNHPVVDLSREAPGPIAIQLAEAGLVRGTLRAGTAPVKEYAVVLLDAEAADGTAAQLAFPDDKGRFEFAALRPGRYRIAAHLAAGAAKSRWVSDVAHMIEIEVPAGAPTELELPVAKGGAQ